MKKEAEQPPQAKEADKPPPKSDEFEKRHDKELGVKRFAKIQLAYTFIPLLAAAAGAVLGWFVLARPVAASMPTLRKAAALVEGAGGRLKTSAMDIFKGKNNIKQAFLDIAPNDAAIAKLKNIWREGNTLKRGAQLEETAKILNIKLTPTPKTFRIGTGIGGLILGSTAGGIATGYDKWRKEESARLAAGEVTGDLAKIGEVLAPDPKLKEVLAENERLSTMVAALPTIDVATVEKQGRVEEKQQAASK